jgi:hypothetical protein
LPVPRTNAGTTPLAHYNSFVDETANALVDESLSINNNLAPQNQPQANQLIDQSLYNSFSPSVDKLPKAPPTNPQWDLTNQKDSEEKYAQEEEDLEDQLNQFTQQLLPDTVGFEVPKSMPVLKSNGDYQKPSTRESDNFGIKPNVSSFSSSGLDLKKGPAPVKLSSPGTISNSTPGIASAPAPASRIDFNNYPEDDYAPTDEMEALLDKSWEKTEDIPVLTEKTADMPVLTEKTQDIPILEKEKTQDIPLAKPSSNSTAGVVVAKSNISTAIAPKIDTTNNILRDTTKDNTKEGTNQVKSNFSSSNVSRPLQGNLSIISAPTGSLVENSRRTERVILIVLTLIALVGVSILIWVLLLKPLGIL